MAAAAAAAATGGGGAAFVYGTLMADEVLTLLIKRVPRWQPATLSGYVRHRVRGQVFPAIVPATPQDSVKGKVLLELTPSELHILDVYESEEYYRTSVQPQLEDGSTVAADVYVWKDEFRDQLLAEQPDWSFDEFMSQHLAAYLVMSAEFMDELVQQQQQQKTQ